MTMTLTSRDVNQLSHGDHHDPHTFLGLHSLSPIQKVIRLWRPGAKTIYLEVLGNVLEAKRVHQSGLFEIEVPAEVTEKDYKVYHQNGLLAEDPYAFLPTLGEIDQYLFGKGTHYNIHEVLGAHPWTQQGVKGVKFAVWAPAARRVSLVADFNHFNGQTNPMRCIGNSGIWELFVPGLQAGEKYKFEIKTQNKEIKVKADPFAHYSELRPATASIVADLEYKWTDEKWMKSRRENISLARPLNIYEVHLGSWKKKDGKFLNYRELAKELAVYCKDMSFTHVELLPIMEHPLDESWGYQVTGFYAVTSRFGTVEDFQWFVNHLHQNNIGVILDWVPGHFPTDDFSLGRFDGTALFEHEDPRQGFHPHWNTNIFNFGRHEVVNFLIGNALFWFEKMHIDGLRVDAVASMLYLDYGREEGEWIPNKYGGRENLEAIEFMKHLNSVVHDRHPGVLMIAEESTAFTGVSHPVSHGGLGFDMKWNMGWMNDTLRYISKDMIHRKFHHNDLTFGLLYAFSEKFVLVFSHDEVVHGKNSLMGKMPGADHWQQFANMRLLYSYMMCQPGKKLLFMGGEIGQWNEWNSKGEVEWALLRFPFHHSLQVMIGDLNRVYHQHPALWERDFDHTGFEWVDFSDSNNSVIAYLRKSEKETVLCVHNFTPNYHQNYHLPLRNVKSLTEIFNSDAAKYSGSGKDNLQPQFSQSQITIQLAPLATMIFNVTFL